MALMLAREPARLAAIKQKLAHNRETFPLFDTARFTRHLEAAYLTMWEGAQRGEPPQSFAVAPLSDGAATAGDLEPLPDASQPTSPLREEVNPTSDSLFTQAVASHRAGRLTEAEQIYRQILIDQPAHFDSLNLLGVLHHQRGQYDDAVRLIDAALQIYPRAAIPHNNRGAALYELGRLDEAVASFSEAIALQPDYADAFYHRGNALKDLKRYEGALADYERAITLRPNHPESFNNRGSALKGLKRVEEAIASYDCAIALKHDYAEALSNRGNALLELRRFGEALASYDGAAALRPDLADAFFNRGIALAELQRADDALASYDRAIALKPDYAEALCNRGTLLASLGCLDEAMMSYQRAVSHKPEVDYLKGMHLHAKMRLCDWANFADECAALSAAVAAGEPASLPFPLLTIAASATLQLQCAKRYCSDRHPVSPTPLWRGERYAHDRIRVAYLSADFLDHATAYLMAGLFEQHDRSRFETTAISFGPADDSFVRRRLRQSFDRFIDVRELGDEAIAECVRQLEVDIAVDLKGFTQGARTNVFARRPAPVQVSYLGYPGSMGASYIDYLIADRVVVPEDQHTDFTEQVVYLPDTYQVNDASRPIAAAIPARADIGLPDSGFVFCCFNNSYKITPDVFDVWMRLLRAVDGSVLWLLASNASVPNNLRREAVKRGIAPARVIFAPHARVDEHLARHRLADLFLDTQYYNAHTTASDALWAGLPVLTCSGETFASRVAGSLLKAIGLPELITHSLDDYESLALKLARDPVLLTSIRRKLEANRETYPLFNTTRFTRHIEAAYMTMWERAQRGEPPRSFAVRRLDDSERR
jgi:predicted O-linked N-acetylglucosamine transferase (SPINDLY family)